ncbi:MAG: hypothetical protein ABI211_01535 [Vicinamibacterales bacterium]
MVKAESPGPPGPVSSVWPGVSSVGLSFALDLGGINHRIVLENDVIFGSVNANLLYYQAAAHAIPRARPSWLAGFTTRRVPLQK